MFRLNQIVKGKITGTFVILGFRMIDGEEYAQLKCVNPNNHYETSSGEFALPIEDLRTIE